MNTLFGLLILITLTVSSQVNGNALENVSGRIIQGNTATTVYGYHAHLLLDIPGLNTKVGSGVVITRRLILTTAQNIYGFNTFRAGFAAVYRPELTWRTATLGEVAPDYNPDTLENNIGFLIFRHGELDIPGVTPITLSPEMAGNGLPYVNEQGRVVGFGHTTNGDNFATYLQYAFKRVVDTNECQETYENHNMEHSFCAYDEVTHAKICGGDQGGAFVTVVNGREYLTGLVSYVLEGECLRYRSALFVRVLHYRNLINVMSSMFN